MDPDLYLTVGIVLAVLTIPSLISAWVDSRPPRVAAIVLVAAIALIGTAILRKADGYKLAEIPYVMLDQVARLAW